MTSTKKYFMENFNKLYHIYVELYEDLPTYLDLYMMYKSCLILLDIKDRNNSLLKECKDYKTRWD